MNKSFLKFVTDFGPLAIFFFYYYNSGKNLSVAIPPLIVATLVALAVVWFFEKKIPPMPLVSGILITFFGDFYYEIVFWSRMQRGDNKIEINV